MMAGGADWIIVKVAAEIFAARNLTPATKLNYIRLRDRQGANGETWPSITSLGQDCGVGRDTVIASIKTLVKRGLIEAERMGRTRHYRVKDQSENPTNQAHDRSENPTDSNADKSENPTGRKTQPVGKSDLDRSENPTPSVGKSDLHIEPAQEPSKGTSTVAPAAPADLFGTEPGAPSKRKRKASPNRAKAKREPDTLTGDAVAVFADAYKASRGVVFKPTGPDLACIRDTVHKLADGKLAEFRRRVDFAGGLNDRAPPFPFNKRGSFTPRGIKTNWTELGDALTGKEDADDRNGSEKRTASDRPRAVPVLREGKQFRRLN